MVFSCRHLGQIILPFFELSNFTLWTCIRYNYQEVGPIGRIIPVRRARVQPFDSRVKDYRNFYALASRASSEPRRALRDREPASLAERDVWARTRGIPAMRTRAQLCDKSSELSTKVINFESPARARKHKTLPMGRVFCSVARGLGFEPRLEVPKTPVLPLDDPRTPSPHPALAAMCRYCTRFA
jgi:hypothetical protein